MPVAPKAGTIGSVDTSKRVKVRVLFPHLLSQPPQKNIGSSEIGCGGRKQFASLGLKAEDTSDTPVKQLLPSKCAGKANAVSCSIAKSSPTSSQAESIAGAALTSAEPSKELQEPPGPSREPQELPQPKTSLASLPGGVPVNEDVLAWDGLKLTMRDLQCLDDGSMLNDSVVDFFLRLIRRYLLPRADIHVFSCHLFTRLTAAGASDGEIGWENVKGWTKKTNVFGHRYAVVPINSELHWWLAIVELQNVGLGSNPKNSEVPMVWVDSLHGPCTRYDHVFQFLSGYLRREWVERAGTGEGRDTNTTRDQLTMTSCDLAALDQVPQQENGVDCGVFLLENVLRLLEGGKAQNCNSASEPASITTEGAVAWCDQEQATHRRSCLRRTVHRLQAEMRTHGPSCSFNVPKLLELRPELVAKLRVLWGIPVKTPGSPLSAKNAQTCPNQCAEAAGDPPAKRVCTASNANPSLGAVKKLQPS